MNKRARSALVILCRVGSAVALLAGIPAASTAQTPEGYELRLLQPGEASFDTLLQKTPSKQPVPQITRSARLQGALLVNDSAHPIVAFAIRWRVKTLTGPATFSFQSLASEPGGGEVLTGLKPLLTTGEQIYVTPGVHWTKDLGQVPAVATFPSGAAPGASVAAEVDAVLFADGTISGPNQSRLFERIQAERHGQIDEAEFIAKLIADGKNDEQIRRTLESHVQRGRAVGNETERDWYAAARGRQALRMAVALQNDGRPALQTFTDKVAKIKKQIEARASVARQ